MSDQAPRPRRERQRDFDLVLFGATGFTGRLVAEYLSKHPSRSEFKWAIAGRNKHKLDAICAELAPVGAPPPALLADSHDRASLDSVVSRTHVVCTTVGPYAQHGSELVASAVAHGTDYCDLTGEPHWIRRMIDAHHDAATRAGARIVHCCGFDSIPSDLGTLMLQEAAEQRFGRPLSQVKVVVTELRGGASGGTLASMLGVIDEARRDSSVRRILTNPYSLNPEGEQSGPDGPDSMGVRRERALGVWVGPFIMKGINSRVVRRTNALTGYRYGRDFRYEEVMAFGRGPAGLARAVGFSAGLAGFVLGLNVPPIRKLIERRLPASGEGPDAEARRRGGFTLTLLGTGSDQSGAAVELRARVVGTSDPGYGETAKMLSEAALCLALDGEQLTAPGGVSTPSATLGMRLVDRLRAAGMTFEVS